MNAPSGLRGQIGWVLRGHSRTTGALDILSNDLRDLQQKVAGLQAAIHDLQRGQRDADRRQLEEFDRVRDAVANATDDLTARVVATQEMVRAQIRAGE